MKLSYTIIKFKVCAYMVTRSLGNMLRTIFVHLKILRA